ncbi:hypothetical protein D3C76_871840 [compost metagenome]
MHLGHFSALFDLRTEASCRAGKCRGRQAWVGMPIVGGIRAALHIRAEKWKALVQLVATKDLQVQLLRLRSVCVGLQLGDLVFAVTHPHMPAGDEFQVIVNQFWQTLP